MKQKPIIAPRDLFWDVLVIIFVKFTLFVSPFFNNFKQVITISNENRSGNCL